MFGDQSSLPYSPTQAFMKFDTARREEFFESILSLLTGRTSDLLSYHDVRRLVSARSMRDEGTRWIPLDSIVGSEGRYQDFSRSFLPRDGANRRRWAKLDRAINVLEDVPPIEVYQIGEVYFVRDGHHRVSVARANEFSEIEAHVIRVDSPIDLGVDSTPEELLLKVDAERFNQATGLKELRPESDVRLTEPGLYRQLRQHIEVHRYYLGLEREREIPWSEAVVSWYDMVYCPVVAVIREEGVMKAFPERTEADLYLWISRRREELKGCYLPDMSCEVATIEAAARAVEEAGQPFCKRWWHRLRSALGGQQKPIEETDRQSPRDCGVAGQTDESSTQE